MKVSAAITVALVAAAAAATGAAAIDPPKKVPLAEKAAGAGAEAGRDEGARAGATAGEIAARQAVKGYVAPTFAECHQLGKANPGAIGFFRKYDADKNWALSLDEWTRALTDAIEHQFLPADFSTKAEWEKVERNGAGEVTCREFVTYTKGVKAMSDKEKEEIKKAKEAEAARKAERLRLIKGE